MINHRVTRWIFAFAAGLLLSLYAFERISDPEPARERAREEAVVLTARGILQRYVAPRQSLDMVDPLQPNRKIGKVYVYPADAGWEISGHYRRNVDDRWHPYLMSLDGEMRLTSLAVKDADERLLALSSRDPKFSAAP
jgi:hypothetical protein